MITEKFKKEMFQVKSQGESRFFVGKCHVAARHVATFGFGFIYLQANVATRHDIRVSLFQANVAGNVATSTATPNRP